MGRNLLENKHTGIYSTSKFPWALFHLEKPSFRYNGNSYDAKTVLLYWNGPLGNPN